MSKITEAMIKDLYNSAKKVNSNSNTLSSELDELWNKHNINRSSATFYINNYKYMHTGKYYSRTMQEYATEYYLNHIYNEEGLSVLKVALSSVIKHIDYFENLGKGKINGIREIWQKYNSLINNIEENYLLTESEDDYIEGKAKKVYVNIYERDLKARKKCIEYYGNRCFVCGIVLSEVYGILGADYIQVHHIIELSTIRHEYKVDPIKDLRPLCPNCHSIIHRKKPAYTIDEVKNTINSIQ